MEAVRVRLCVTGLLRSSRTRAWRHRPSLLCTRGENTYIHARFVQLSSSNRSCLLNLQRLQDKPKTRQPLSLPYTGYTSPTLSAKSGNNLLERGFRPAVRFTRLPPCWRFEQVFHTSAPVRALPAPFVWLVLKPLQKILAIILGRSIRKWWASLPPNRRQLVLQSAWRRRWQLAAGGAGLILLFLLFFLTHLEESPVTGRTRLLAFSKESFLELAQHTTEMCMEELKESFIPVEDPRQQLVERLVTHLAERNQDILEISRLSWSVHVVDSPTVNAFILPTGKVFVFTGMLEAVADIHQLTFILGHEMAHVLIGHSAEQASLSHIVDLLSLILLTAIWAVCPRDSLAVLGHWIQGKLVQFVFHQPYSRKLETEADQVGLQMAAKACADIRAGPVFWQQMEVSDRLTGEPTVPEWLSTHPSHKNRANQLDRLVPEALELRARCNCPALPSTDPRAVFSASVRLLLNNTKDRGTGGQRDRGSQEINTLEL